MGLFDKLKQGLKKTTQLLKTDVRDLFKAQGRLVDDSFHNDLFENADQDRHGRGGGAGNRRRALRPYRARVIEMQEAIEWIKEKLKALLAQPAEPIRFAASGPTVIMVAGVNGCGKTTSIAKLAKMFKDDGKKVVLARPTRFVPPPSSS